MKICGNIGKDINLILSINEQESIHTTIITGQVKTLIMEQMVQILLIVEGITTQRKSNVGAAMDLIYIETSIIILIGKWPW